MQQRILPGHSVAIDTELSFGEWATGFGAAKMTAELLDRFTHRRQILEAGNVASEASSDQPAGRKDNDGSGAATPT